MFKNTKVKKMFEDDEPKIVFYLESRKMTFEEIFKCNEDLIEQSIKEHKNSIAEAAITYCTNLNRLNKQNQSYIMIAIQSSNIDIFKKLLTYDIKLDVLDINRESALFYAIRNENKEFFDLLISKNVDLKGFNIKGENTAIHAYLYNRKDITNFLLKNKVFINHLDKDGNTILHHAIKNKDIEFSLKLIDYGADFFIKNYANESCLDIAHSLEIDIPLINKHCEMIDRYFLTEDSEKLKELLVEHHDVDQYEKFNIPFLIAAFSAKYNHKEIFDRVLRTPELLSHIDYRGKSLLMYCIEFGEFILARKIIYLNGNLNLRDNDNRTILFTVLEQLNNDNLSLSIKEDYNMIFKELLERKVDVNCQDHLGNTVLMYAIMNSQQSIINKLIEYPYIDLNIMNNEDKTALIISYELGDTETVQKIISSQKAEINTMDKENHTLLLLTLLDDNLELFDALLHNGADLNLKYKDGLTILMIALNMQKKSFIAKIFEHPVFDVNIQDDHGKTALMHAISQHNTKVVAALLKCGANTKILDHHGDSAIFYAVTKEAFEIAKLLRDYEDKVS